MAVIDKHQDMRPALIDVVDYINDDLQGKFTSYDDELANVHNKFDGYDQSIAQLHSEDTALNGRIDTETNNRIEGDVTNKEAIDAEVKNRKAADTSIKSQITSEASMREREDAALQANIDAQVATVTEKYQAADQKIIDSTSEAIQAEQDKRTLADKALQESIDTKISASDINVISPLKVDMEPHSDLGSVAIGDNANAKGNNSIAIGGATVAESNNSVALGNESVAYIDNSVSFGNDNLMRRLMYVSDGVDSTDAVNYRQFKEVQSKIEGYDASIKDLNDSVSAIKESNETETDERIKGDNFNKQLLNSRMPAKLANYLATLPDIEYGNSDALSVSASGSAEFDIKFATTKTESPNVIVSCYCNGSEGDISAVVQSVTTTGAHVHVFNHGTKDLTNVTVDWLALSGR